MNSLSGKTLFISGASRGIGLAIAMRAARDGANMTIAAKTAVALGATIVEKHFKLDNDDKSVDAHFSLDISKLKNLKREFHLVQKTLGSNKIRVTKSAKRGQR